MGIKLYYFNMAARAEPIRLTLLGGNVEFEDVRLSREEWAESKDKMPFKQMPAMEVEGVVFAQSSAILTYSAKVGGLYPKDPVKAALADQVVAFMEDIIQHFIPTFRMEKLEDRLSARKEIVAGPLKTSYTMLSKLLEGKKYVAGDELSHGDMALFCALSNMRSGLIDGVPTTILDDFPVLKEYRNNIAKIDFVAKYYADVTEGPRATYKADA